MGLYPLKNKKEVGFGNILKTYNVSNLVYYMSGVGIYSTAICIAINLHFEFSAVLPFQKQIQ